ncbi:hypothetical protein [Mycobacterium avium]|uniref:hypothetical protein n=1 Tax=Mycobacterium avium TaxID=1764 RepID=UPI003F5CE7E8
MNVRSAVSTQAPTGPAAWNHELAATTTEKPSSSSAMPSRRCPGSMSRARPIDRAAPPVPPGGQHPAGAQGAAAGQARGDQRRVLPPPGGPAGLAAGRRRSRAARPAGPRSGL